jgi:hypothetical protein
VLLLLVLPLLLFCICSVSAQALHDTGCLPHL